MIESLTIHYEGSTEPLHITRTDELDGESRTIIRGGEGGVSADRIATFVGVRATIAPNAEALSLDDLFATRRPVADRWLAGWLPEVRLHGESNAFVVVRPIAEVEIRQAVVA